jgi:hypothetical protein
VQRIVNSIVAGALLLGSAGSSFAEGRIATRKENQQNRIGNGVKSGSLTPRETSHLEKRERGLNKEIRSDRKANGGNLTNNEKSRINRQQSRLSRNIYRDKHNSRVQPQ